MRIWIVAAAAVLLPLSPAAMAQSDCHRDMKDMLEGTLEVVDDTENDASRSQAPPESCTLADLRGDVGWPNVLKG